jgi:hypothetical protein
VKAIERYDKLHGYFGDIWNSKALGNAKGMLSVSQVFMIAGFR